MADNKKPKYLYPVTKAANVQGVKLQEGQENAVTLDAALQTLNSTLAKKETFGAGFKHVAVGGLGSQVELEGKTALEVLQSILRPEYAPYFEKSAHSIEALVISHDITTPIATDTTYDANPEQGDPQFAHAQVANLNSYKNSIISKITSRKVQCYLANYDLDSITQTPIISFQSINVTQNKAVVIVKINYDVTFLESEKACHTNVQNNGQYKITNRVARSSKTLLDEADVSQYVNAQTGKLASYDVKSNENAYLNIRLCYPEIISKNGASNWVSQTERQIYNQPHQHEIQVTANSEGRYEFYVHSSLALSNVYAPNLQGQYDDPKAFDAVIDEQASNQKKQFFGVYDSVNQKWSIQTTQPEAGTLYNIYYKYIKRDGDDGLAKQGSIVTLLIKVS